MHLLSLCRGLVKRGHEVDVVYLKGNGTLRGEFEKLGVSTTKIRLEAPADLPACLHRLRAHVRCGPYAVVHTHLLKANFMGSIASRLAGIPRLVASKHNDEPQLRNPVTSWLHGCSSRLDRTIICASQHIRDHVVRHGRVQASRCETIHYGVESRDTASGRSSDLRAEVRAGPATFLIACVARLIARKGHRHLLDALPRILDRERDLRLLIVGDGPVRADLEAHSRSRGLEPYVVFTGQRLDVPQILDQVDLFVLPSEAEGFGLVLLEAMAAGKPAIASDVGGMKEVVVHGETGFLVPAGSPPALADSILRLVTDRELATRMGERGRRRQRETFSVDAMVERILDVYRRAAA